VNVDEINLDSENSVSRIEHLYFAQTGSTIIINPLNPTQFKIFCMKEACSNIRVSFDCGFCVKACNNDKTCDIQNALASFVPLASDPLLGGGFSLHFQFISFRNNIKHKQTSSLKLTTVQILREKPAEENSFTTKQLRIREQRTEELCHALLP